MSSKLVIVESPAKAKTIARLLGRGYKVEASNGHVRDLPKSQLGVDVQNNFEPKYITIRGRGEIVERVKKEAQKASRVLLATDPDREGEAISWHLAHQLKIDADAPCRVVFHEITGPAIKAAVKAPRSIDQNLVDAQQARRVLDRLVGYSISPILWAKVRKGLSAGRVQSVATRIICDREAEIEAFVPVEFWQIQALLSQNGKKTSFAARYIGPDGEKTELKSAAQVDEIIGKIKGVPFQVSSVKTGERRKRPAAPFTTSGLQQEAARKLGFTTKRTMMIAQQIYEGVDLGSGGAVGLVTYIRTDSTRIAQQAQEAAAEFIKEQYGSEYLPETPNQYKSRKSAQDAHEAIRPTALERTPQSVKDYLSKEQFRLYKLVFDRFIASQMNEAVYEATSADIASGGGMFRATGARLVFPGFTRVYEEGRDDEQEKETVLPKLEAGEELNLLDLTGEQHFTQPPPRYTEASLVRAMEEKGIGRPSTYAPIISTIIERGYIFREKKALMPTELGDVVTDLMKQYFEDIVDEEFTAGLEDKLDSVEEGEADWRQVVGAFYGPFKEALDHAESTMEKVVIKDEITDVPCKECGAMMVKKMGRFGPFLACPRFPECRNTQPIIRKLNVPCPRCGAAILVRKSKRGRTFYGCERYPDCDYISWDQPVEGRCPNCGGIMVRKNDRKNGAYALCTAENCATRVKLEEEERE